MGSDLQVYKVNEAKIAIQCNETITKELFRYFSVKMPNAKFHPLVKQGIWDGMLRFFDIKQNQLNSGLAEELKTFAIKGKYTIEYMYENDGDIISMDNFLKFVKSLNITDGDENPMEPRDYQIQAAFDAINEKRLNIKSATASGKSLILYIIIRYFEQNGLKTILVVPNVALVHQMYEDFETYGWDRVSDKCHMIHSGQKKVFDCPIIITTWQSLYKDKKLFNIFQCLLIDEVHLAKGQSIQTISSNCINAIYRVGCSGTFPEYKSPDWFSIVGACGQIREYNTYKSLQDSGHIAKLKIYLIRLLYPQDFRRIVYEHSMKDYHKELDLIHEYPDRNQVLLKMAQNFDGNSLFLFTKIEKHGLPLRQLFSDNLKDKLLIYIDGSVSVEERENYRKMVETKGLPYRILHFDVGEVKVHLTETVLLSDGTKKSADKITIKDDIDETWIKENLNNK